MKLFNPINIENYIYSELLAIAYINPSFFAFLDSEKNRYIMNDLVLRNLIIIELDRLKIDISESIKNIIIENDWDALKKVVMVADKIRAMIPNQTDDVKISVKDNTVFIINDSTMFVFRPLSEIKNIELIYPENYDVVYKEYICMKTDLYAQNLKDVYKEKYKSFFTILKEKGLELNEITYHSDIYTTLGVRFDNLPNLYYKSLAMLDSHITTDMFDENNIEYVKSALSDINKTYLTQLKTTQIEFITEYSNYHTYDINTDSILYIPELTDYKVCTNREYNKLIFKYEFNNFSYNIEKNILTNVISFKIINNFRQ
jgi:hypothetical protein